jgi:hypothetical protein
MQTQNDNNQKPERVTKQEHPFPIFLFCTGLALLVYFLAIW